MRIGHSAVRYLAAAISDEPTAAKEGHNVSRKTAGQQRSAAENKQISDVTWLARCLLYELEQLRVANQ